MHAATDDLFSAANANGVHKTFPDPLINDAREVDSWYTLPCKWTE